MKVTIEVFDTEDGGIGFDISSEENGIADKDDSIALYLAMLTRMMYEGELQETEQFLADRMEAYMQTLADNIESDTEEEK